MPGCALAVTFLAVSIVVVCRTRPLHLVSGSAALRAAALLCLIATPYQACAGDPIALNFWGNRADTCSKVSRPNVSDAPGHEIARPLDVVLVVGGTPSMNLILDDVKSKTRQVLQAIHKLAPPARAGIVAFGGVGGSIESQPLTLSLQTQDDFLSRIAISGADNSVDRTYEACVYAINRMDWKPCARKVIVLVGDSTPSAEDLQSLIGMIQKFRKHNGTFSAVEVATAERQRLEQRNGTHQRKPCASAVPHLSQTRAVYGTLAYAGGGKMKSFADESQAH